jgi:ATP-dependent Clp protease ATP-binding subunit ClpA
VEEQKITLFLLVNLCKTAVAEGLAQLILTESSRFLDGSLIMALDLGSIL